MADLGTAEAKVALTGALDLVHRHTFMVGAGLDQTEDQILVVLMDVCGRVVGVDGVGRFVGVKIVVHKHENRSLRRFLCLPRALRPEAGLLL